MGAVATIILLYLLQELLYIGILFSILLAIALAYHLSSKRLEISRGWKPATTFISLLVLLTSTALATIVLILLPYFLPQHGQLSFYSMLAVLLFLTAFVLFSSMSFIYRWSIKVESHKKRVLFFSAVSAVVIVIIGSGILMAIIHSLSHKTADIVVRDTLEITTFFNNVSMTSEAKSLLVFQEIEKYRLDFNQNFHDNQNLLLEEIQNRKYCVRSDCFSLSVDAYFNLIELSVNSMLFRGIDTVGMRKFDLVTSGKYRDENTLLVKQLQSAIVELEGLDLTSIGDDPLALYYVLHTDDMTTREFVESIASEGATADSIIVGLPPFADSMQRAGLHTKQGRKVLQLYLKVGKYTEKALTTDPLINILYENRYAEESLESKIIRYEIILERLSAVQRQINKSGE